MQTGTQTKHARIFGIVWGGGGGTSGAATLNYDETCKLLCTFVHK